MPDIDKIYKVLGKEYEKLKAPVVDLVEAQTKDPFKILVTTILSARTKDNTTSEVVNRLFEIITTPQDIEKYTIEEIEEIIYPVGFFRNKARHLKMLPQVLKEEFNNKIPEEIDDLLKIPGVGRKTANLVRTIAFKKPAMCVDVHVHRISNRLGYVKTKTPFETEMALRKKLPEKYWLMFNSYLVAFGQNHCTPRNPKCSSCVIYDECGRVGLVLSLKEYNDFE
jgi:endonuclease III